jgi:general secretion pathway protein L
VANLLIRSRGQSHEIAQSSGDEAGLRDLAQALIGRNPKLQRLVLRVPQEHVLRKRLSLPLAGGRDLKNLLRFEIDRETPFEGGEIYWDYAVRRQDASLGRLELELFIIPRSVVDPFVTAARRAGLAPTAIAVETELDGTVFIELASEERIPWLSRSSPLVPIAAAASALVLIAIASPFAYQQWQIASADATLAPLEGPAREAIELRQSADRLTRTAEFFKAETEHNGSALAILAGVTRVLPDDSYLTSLNLNGSRLVMSGLSPAAANLVTVFAHSPLFREPTFDSPVTGSEGGDLESFTISVTLATAGAS